jgi:hypothetical protein
VLIPKFLTRYAVITSMFDSFRFHDSSLTCEVPESACFFAYSENAYFFTQLPARSLVIYLFYVCNGSGEIRQDYKKRYFGFMLLIRFSFVPRE